MKAWTWTVSAVVVLAAAACARKPPVVEISQDRIAEARQWTARLATPPAMEGALQAQGTATMAAGPEHSETIIAVHLSNVAPGGVHPWRVHTGQCGREGTDVVRVTDDGRMLKVNDEGRADASATVTGMPVPVTGDYAVTVVASPENQAVVIACGNFAPQPGTPGVTP
jgi:hypothetical protein